MSAPSSSSCAASTKFGTGILIGPDLVLTNYHVIEECDKDKTQAFAKTLRCRFDYRGVDKGKPGGREIELAPTGWLVASSPYSPLDKINADSGRDRNDLDYAVLRLSRRIGDEPVDPTMSEDMADPRGWENLQSILAPPAMNELVSVLHYPVELRAEPPQIPLRRSPGLILNVIDGGLRIRHNAATAPGSSGSPCFNQSETFFGLHQGSDRPGADGKVDWNQAIPINEIIRHLVSLNLQSIVDAKPPESAGADPAPRLQAQPIADKNRIATGLMPWRQQVARVLLDRNKPETDIVRVKLASGIVHVVVSRSIDQDARFFERLAELSLMLPSTGIQSALQRRAYLASTPKKASGGWPKIALERPDRSNSDEDRIAEVMESLDAPNPSRKGRLIQFSSPIRDCSVESEKALVLGVAQRCAKERSAENLQIFFHYYDSESTAAVDKWADKRQQFASLWNRGAEPLGCGACVALGDVGSGDLIGWISDLNAVWKIDEQDLRTKIDQQFSGVDRLPMSDVETRLNALILECVNISIANA